MRVRNLRLLVSACLCLAFYFSVIPAAAQQTIAIKAGRLIDGTGAPAINDAVVLVRGDRIEAAGPASAVQIPTNAKVIDLGTDTVMPGMINGHDHPTVRAFTGPQVPRLGRNSLVMQLDEMAEAPAIQMVRGVRDLRVDLLAGVTTEYVVGEVQFNDTNLNQMCQAGVVPCPRLYPSGPWIMPTSGYYPIPETNGPWAMRIMVRKNVEAGAQHIKIVIVRAMATGPSNGRPYGEGQTNWTNEEMSALVDEAHRLGVKVTAHAGDVVSIRQALDNGVDSIQHASQLPPDLIDLFVQKHAGFINTYAAGLQGHFTPDDFRYLDTEAMSPEDWVTHARGIAEQSIAQGSATAKQRLQQRYGELRMARDKGVPMAVGTDNMQGLLDIDVENLVNAGLTPLQAISAATGMGARVLGIDKEVGTLQAGKYADIISIKGRPDSNIRDLSKVHFVMVGGVNYTDLSFR